MTSMLKLKSQVNVDVAGLHAFTYVINIPKHD